MKRLDVPVLLAVALAYGLTACSWLQSHPAVVTDAEDDAVCILMHAEEPPAQILVDCARTTEKTVTDVLSAHRRAMGRELGACQPVKP